MTSFNDRCYCWRNNNHYSFWQYSGCLWRLAYCGVTASHDLGVVHVHKTVDFWNNQISAMTDLLWMKISKEKIQIFLISAISEEVQLDDCRHFLYRFFFWIVSEWLSLTHLLQDNLWKQTIFCENKKAYVKKIIHWDKKQKKASSRGSGRRQPLRKGKK